MFLLHQAKFNFHLCLKNEGTTESAQWLFFKSCVLEVTETSCVKATADQCEHTPNAECDNAETDAKCKCSDGFIEDTTDGSTCVKSK